MPASKRNPDAILHLQVEKGSTVIYRHHAYGDRATLQVRAGDLDQVTGKYVVVDPSNVPDVGELPAAA